MERLLIKEISNHEGEKITIKGRIFNIRNLGSISFLIIRDYSGVVQVIASKNTEVNSGDIVLSLAFFFQNSILYKKPTK
jgi:aspartyl/asparaginyl-tRNA synthetase